jgi:hypothetical protein
LPIVSLLRERSRPIRRRLAALVGLAVHVVGDLGLVGIGVGDALVVFARDAFGDGGVPTLAPVGTTP